MILLRPQCLAVLCLLSSASLVALESKSKRPLETIDNNSANLSNSQILKSTHSSLHLYASNRTDRGKERKQERRGDKQEVNKLLDLASSDPRLVRVDSKPGKAIARMQGKRQVDSSGTTTVSKRNEDPWFLDQAPYPLQPYRFVYNIKGKDGQTEQYRQEVGDGKFLSGSYGYVLPDGIYRHVDYVADDRGFRAFIRTSEPGTANENPANVVINSNPVPGSPFYARTQQSEVSSAGAYVPPTDYSPASFASSSSPELPRRAPGSIVNTPLRNFTSLSYVPSSLQQQQPVTTLPPIQSAFYEPPARNFTTLSFPSRPPSDSLNSNYTATGWAQTRADDDAYNLQRINSLLELQQRPRTRDESNWREPPPVDNHLRASYEKFNRPFDGPIQTTTPTTTTQMPQLNRRPFNDLSSFGSLSQQQSGSAGNRLAYDRPLSYQGDTGGRRKLTYDTDYILHPSLPFVSLERARGLAHLEQLNAVGRGSLPYIRPLTAPPSTLGLLTSGRNQSESRHFSSSGSSSEQSHNRYEEHHSKLADSSKVSSTKEHQSGSRSGSGHESEIVHRGEGILSPPPPPNYRFQVPVVPAEGVKGGSRLQAPYTSFPPQQQHEEQQPQQSPAKDYDNKSSAQSTPQPQPEGRSEVGNSQQPKIGSTVAEAEGPTLTTTRTFQPDQDDNNDATTKGHSATKGGGSVRTIRMPEDFRSSMMMHDLRSMQNVIGLPQPPRSAHLVEPNPIDQIVSARMSRVEALLSSSRSTDGHSQQPIGSGQAASAIRRTVSAPPLNELTNRTRQLSTGPLSKVNLLDPLADLQGLLSLGANETFDARRLTNKAKLQAEKVSELEKFQQRLRTQQLLLENTKNPPERTQTSKLSSPKFGNLSSGRATQQLAELNSHVKYDEEVEGSAKGQQQVFKLLDPRRDDYSRPRRQDGDAEKPTSTEAPNTRTTTPTSSPTHNNKLKEASKVDLRNSTEGGNVTSGGANTINLDFINSVTALSVDGLNPFAMSSVNPAVQRSSGRLSPYRLESATERSSERQSSPPLSASSGVGVSPARYLSSSDLLNLQLASNNNNERRSESLKSLLQPDGLEQHQWNHRNAPYSQWMSAAAQEAHGSFTQAPLNRHQQAQASSVSTPSSNTKEQPEAIRDGFEVRDRALQVDNERFYEVVSRANNLVPAEQSSGFQAFRDAQLSIPALSSR